MLKTVSLLFCLLVSTLCYSQSNQEKAQILVTNYLENKFNSNSNSDLKFSAIEVSKSSYTDTKNYKNFQHKIDSLKLEGRKIDARIPKMKTDAEINQAKKDSKHLSNQLVATSDEMIDFMTEYKGIPVGWILKTSSQNKKGKKKIFYLNKDLTKITAVK